MFGGKLALEKVFWPEDAVTHSSQVQLSRSQSASKTAGVEAPGIKTATTWPPSCCPWIAMGFLPSQEGGTRRALLADADSGLWVPGRVANFRDVADRAQSLPLGKARRLAAELEVGIAWNRRAAANRWPGPEGLERRAARKTIVSAPGIGSMVES